MEKTWGQSNGYRHVRNAFFFGKTEGKKMLKRTLIVLFALILGFTSVIDARAVVIDTIAPVVSGVEENGAYDQPVTITYDEGSGVLNDVAIESPKTVSDVGTYTLVVTDLAGNATTIHFSVVDNTAPIIEGVVEGGKYSDPVTITFNEGTALLNGAPFENGATVEAIGSYTLVVTDASTNSTTIHFARVAKTEAVSSLKAVNAGYNSITLSWAAITNVSGYEMWRSTGTSTTFTYLGSLTSTSYTNTGLAFNTRYNYKVRVYTLINGVKSYGAFSSVAYATTALLTPSLTVTSASYNSLKVAWNAIAGASGYQLYRSTSATGVYTLVATTTATSYVNSLLATNSLYFYKVRAYRTVGTAKYYSGYSSVQSARPIPSQVVSNTVVSTGYNSLKASWATVAGANGYEVYRSETMDGTFALVTTTAATSFVLNALTTNVPVFVKVRAYRLVGTTKIYGDFSSVTSGTPIPSTPVLSIASPSFNSLRVSWAAIAGASGYELYHLNSGTGLYELLNDGTDLFYVHADLVSGINHSYKVKAYTLVGDTKVYSLDSSVVSNKAIPNVPTLPKAVFANYNSITVSYTAVEGATGYEIYRSTAAAGVYALVTTTSDLSYVNTGLAFNTVYYYQVRAYTLVDSAKVYGNYTAVVYARTSVNTPVITPVSSGYDRITVSWPGITGASGYEVYQSTSTAGVYTLLITTASTSYTKTALVTNTAYFYKVRAYRLVGTVKVYSGFSTIVSARPVPATPVVTVASAGYNSVKASWAAITGANGYEVSYSLTEDGTYTLLPLQSATSYTLTNQATNQPVFFKVRAYRLVGTLKVFGVTSVVKCASPIPSTPIVALTTLSYKSLKLTWPLVLGASGYEIYTKTGDDFVLSADQTDLTITFDGLTSGVVQTYKVKAYTLVNEVKIYSNEVIVSGKALPLVPAVSANINYNSIQLNWNPVEGAAGYEVYRSTTATGVYTLLSTTDATTLTMNGLAFNALYYFRVRAFTLVDDVKVYGNYTANLAYRVSVATPTVTVASTSYVSIRIGWSASAGASGYEVYRAASATGVYALVVTTASTSYINTGLATNGLYYYKVRSYRLVGTVKYYSGFSIVQSTRPVPAVPTGVALASAGYDSVKATWVAVAGATGYEIYTSDAQDGTYTLKTTTSSLNATVSGFATNVMVYTKVRAYRLVGTTKVYGDYSAVANATPIPSKPVVTVGNLSHTSLKVSWPAIAGADGYEVYHLVGSDYVLVQDNNDPFLTVNELVSGEVHTYKVIAYRIVDNVRIYSQETIASGKAFPLTPVVTATINYSSIQLNWASVEGASGYEIVRSATATGTYALIATVNTNTYLNSGLAFNTTYYYKVRAFALVNDVKVYGNDTGVLTYKTNVAAPIITAKSASYVSTNLSWTAVSGASGYEVSRATVLTGPYTVLVSATSATSYVNSALTTNTLYYYRVRSYRLVGTVKYYSAYSTVVSIRPVPGVSTNVTVTSTGYDSLKVAWNAVAGATGYEIFTSAEIEGTYTLKTSTSALSVSISGYPTMMQVYAKVRAYRLVGTTKVYGDFSHAGSGYPLPSKPVVSASYPSATSVKLTWPAVPGATGYYIQLLGSMGSQNIAKITEREFTLTDCTPGEGYYLTVIAYVALPISGEATSEGTSINAVPVPPAVNNFKVNSFDYSEIVLKWDVVPGADGYEIYHSTSATGTFTLIEDTKENLYMHFALTFNTAHYYKIRAYAFGKTKTIFGSTSAYISGRTAMRTPTAFISSVAPTSIKVGWNSVLGPSKYEIYRSTSATGTYTLIGTSYYEDYTNTGLTLGASYYYKVRGVDVLGATSYYTAFSSPVLGKTALVAPDYAYISDVSSTSIGVSWHVSPGAAGYELYAALLPSTEYTLIYSGTSNSFQHSNLQKDQRYSYKIRSYATVNNVKIYSPYSTSIVEGYSGVNVPHLNVRQKGSMEIEFYYDEGDQRVFQEGVEVYIVDPITQELTLLTSSRYASKFTSNAYVGKTNLTLTLVFVGVHIGNDGVVMKSQPSEPTTLVLGNPAPTGLYVSSIDETSVGFRWDETKTPIEMWRSETIDGEYTLLVSFPSLSFAYTDKAVELGKKYYYKMRRVSVDQQTMLNVYSDFTEPLQVGPGFFKPNLKLKALTPTLISYSISGQTSADGYEICNVNSSGVVYGACPAINLTSYAGELEVDSNSTYRIVARAYLYKPDGTKYYSEFSDPVSITTPFEPNLAITSVTTYDGKSTVTFDFKNNGERAILIYGSPTYVYDLNNVYAEYPAVMKDAANVPITGKLIGSGITQRITFTISTPNVVFNSNRFIAFNISYDGYEYVLCYSPYLGVFYLAYF